MILAAAAFANTALAGSVLASSTTNSTSTLSNVEPGVLGFLVVAAMGLALVFLLRSMNKQFRKITPQAGTSPGENENENENETARQETPK